MEEASTDFKYLQKLKFDPRQYKSFVYKLISNFRIVVLIILLIIGIGIYSFISLPRELNPEIDIPIVSVSAALPGASPKDIEQLILDPIEKAISPLKDVDYIESTANRSFGSIIVYMKDNTDLDKAVDEIHTEIETIELPDDATNPSVIPLDFNEIPVLQTSIVSGLDLLSLSKTANELKDQLENSKLIEKVTLTGELEERIYINLSFDNIQKFNVTAQQIVLALKSSDINLPSGNYKVNSVEYQINVDNTFKSISDIRDLVLNIKGQAIPLSEVAQITYTPDKNFENPIKYQERTGDQLNAVEINIFKAESAKIGDAVVESAKIIDSLLEDNKDIKRIDISNQAESITIQFSELIDNFYQTIFLCFLVLFLFLGVRQASVAAISIPLTLLSIFIVMKVSGYTINFLSLFSILLALGLIVDNSIVIVSAFDSYRKTGKFTDTEAALMVYKDFKIPILTTTLCAIWAFLPLLLSTGIIGEYIKSIPIIVSAGLIACAIITIFINLPLLVSFSSKPPAHVTKAVTAIVYIILGLIIFTILTSILDKSQNTSTLSSKFLNILAFSFSILLLVFLINLRKLNKKYNFLNRLSFIDKGIFNFAPVVNYYEVLLRKILFSRTKKILVVVITLLLFIISITFAATGLLKTEFFPKSDSELIYINLNGPAGWTNTKLQPYIHETIEIVKVLNELEFLTVTEGFNIGTDLAPTTGNNFAYVIVSLVKKEDRKINSIDITEELRKRIESEIDIDTTVFQISGGPPAGADIQVDILGDDFTILERLSNQFIEILDEVNEISNVESTYTQASGQISVNLSNDELAKRQLSTQEVSLWLRSILSETEVGEITNVNQQDFKIFVNINTTFNLSDIENLIILSNNGKKYTLGEIAEIKLENSPNKIDRRDRKRLISVLGFINKGESATEVFAHKIKPQLDKLEIPSGYTWDVGGVNKQNQDSVNSIVIQMLLSFGLILTTMVIQMNSFRKAGLVLSIIPIAIAGVFFNFTIFGIPLSFPALIGILALFGIVVNNTILLIEKINQNHNIGLKFSDSIIDGCVSRMEPIFFTAITNIVGLIPITLSDPLWRGLGGAIIAGLSFSGIIILFLLPVMYSWMFKSTYHGSHNMEHTSP